MDMDIYSRICILIIQAYVGEHVKAMKWESIVKELILKASIYNYVYSNESRGLMNCFVVYSFGFKLIY
jgi:hypothetical protein